MRNIRKSVFETNSSSSHSLVITTVNEHYTRAEMMKNVYMSDDGIINMWGDNLEFYRSPFDILSTFFDKTRYAIASSEGALVPQIKGIFKKYIPGFTDFKFDETAKYVEDDFGDWIESGWVTNYGATDDYEIESWLKHYDVSLEEFLTNRRYIVIVDGDEYRVWDHILVWKQSTEDV